MPEYSNFKLIHESKDRRGISSATIDVTTGRWWWKKTKTMDISCSVPISFECWFFTDTGKWVLGEQFKEVLRSWDVKQKNASSDA